MRTYRNSTMNDLGEVGSGGNANKPRVALVSVQPTLSANGFRRIASVARAIDSDADIYFIAPGNTFSMWSILFPGKLAAFSDDDAEAAGKHLAQYDLVCFSSMSESAAVVGSVMKALRRHNPNTFIYYGGMHTLFFPDEAISHADAICRGEGEKPFKTFLEAFIHKKPFFETSNTWFRTADGVIKNEMLPLYSNEELSSFPHLYHGFDCWIYDLSGSKQFRPLSEVDMINYNGLGYRLIWTLGCPFSCSYCGNSFLHKLDKKHAAIRYSTVDYIIDDLEVALKAYPYLASINFDDDNMITLPKETLEEFACKYKSRIGLPFAVPGIHPNTMKSEKFEILLAAGLNRAQMGIQSGSQRIMDFYKRKTSLETVKRSANLLTGYAKKYGAIPPVFDRILDNPYETKDDVADSLRFYNSLDRPFTINLFSLRVYPNTELYDVFQKIDKKLIENSGFTDTSLFGQKKTYENILFYLISFVKLPEPLLEWLISRMKIVHDGSKTFPIIHCVLRSLYYGKRGVLSLLGGDYYALTGRLPYIGYKLGLISGRRKFAAMMKKRQKIRISAS